MYSSNFQILKAIYIFFNVIQ